MQTATFELRSTSGVIRAYPVGETAHAIWSLIGAKTLPDHAIMNLRRIGIDPMTTAGNQLKACDLG